MKRLIEEIVFSGLTAACRRASWPTRRSPDFVNATTEGVVREPSELGTTVGSPASMTAMTELVVPRSIPTVLGIFVFSSGCLAAACRRSLPPRGRPLEKLDPVEQTEDDRDRVEGQPKVSAQTARSTQPPDQDSVRSPRASHHDLELNQAADLRPAEP